jgi:hypothetical protein
MDGFWGDYLSIDVPLAVGVAAATALLVRFRMWHRGEVHDDAPMLRQFVAYLLAYLAAFAAVRGLEPPVRYVVTIAAAALAFGVTLNGGHRCGANPMRAMSASPCARYWCSSLLSGCWHGSASTRLHAATLTPPDRSAFSAR